MTRGKHSTRPARRNFMKGFDKDRKRKSRMQAANYDPKQYDKPDSAGEES